MAKGRKKLPKKKKPQKKEQKRKELKPFQDEKGRFKKGSCPNPGGRPKGSVSPTKALLRLLAEEAPDGNTYAEKVAETLLLVSTKGGDVSAIKEILQRADGKVPDRVQHEEMPNWKLTFVEAEENDEGEESMSG